MVKVKKNVGGVKKYKLVKLCNFKVSGVNMKINWNTSVFMVLFWEIYSLEVKFGLRESDCNGFQWGISERLSKCLEKLSYSTGLDSFVNFLCIAENGEKIE